MHALTPVRTLPSTLPYCLPRTSRSSCLRFSRVRRSRLTIPQRQQKRGRERKSKLQGAIVFECGEKEGCCLPLAPPLAPVYRTRLDGTCAGVSQSFCLRSPFSCLIFHLPHSLLFTHAYNAEGGSCVSLFPRDAEGKRERSPSTCIPCLLFPSRGFRRGPHRDTEVEREEKRGEDYPP